MRRATKTSAFQELRASRRKAAAVMAVLEHASSTRYGARNTVERREALLDAGRLADELEVLAGRARWAVREYVGAQLDGSR